VAQEQPSPAVGISCIVVSIKNCLWLGAFLWRLVRGITGLYAADTLHNCVRSVAFPESTQERSHNGLFMVQSRNFLLCSLGAGLVGLVGGGPAWTVRPQDCHYGAGLVVSMVGWDRMRRQDRAQQGRQAGRYHPHRYLPAPVKIIRMLQSLEPQAEQRSRPGRS
jgi:hypothetical protein